MTLVVPIALLSLVTACGGSTTPTVTPTTTPPTTASPTTSASPSAGSDSAKVLTGAVGTEADAEAFVITLKDAAGADVTTLPAGTYQMSIKDPSKFHNFHLSGTGVEQTTGPVADLADPTWSVTLTPGTYTYECDPHPNMLKTFTVT